MTLLSTILENKKKMCFNKKITVKKMSQCDAFKCYDDGQTYDENCSFHMLMILLKTQIILFGKIKVIS